MTAGEFETGKVLLFDKPFDWSSFDVVKKVRYMVKKAVGKDIKTGHAGTLDPYATGLLVLCTGKATKQIESIQAMPKTYTGTIRLGATTPSYDLEHEPDTFFPADHITDVMIEQVRQNFLGEQLQTPPIFSAKKIGGKPAYQLARKGKEVNMRQSLVHIYDLQITRPERDLLAFTAVVSRGTYIRSLAHDIGKALQSGAYLASLRRESIGDYHVDNAYTIETFRQELEAIEPLPDLGNASV